MLQYGGGGGLDLCQLLAIGAFLAVAAAAAAALFLQITESQNHKFCREIPTLFCVEEKNYKIKNIHI